MKSKIGIIIVTTLFIVILAFASIFVDKYSNNMAYESINSGDIVNNGVNEKLEDGTTDLLVSGEDIKDMVDFDGDNKKDKEEENKMNILEITSENFEEEVLKSDKTVLIDFYADWCGPCKMMAPVVERIAAENPDLKVVKINVDNVENIAIKYRVMSIPTFVVIKNGEEVNRVIGAVEKTELEEIIK